MNHIVMMCRVVVLDLEELYFAKASIASLSVLSSEFLVLDDMVR